MFGLGATELIVIMVVALVVFGPKRLPDLARSLGKGMAEFRRASADLRQTLQEADAKPEPRPSPPGPTAPEQIAPPQPTPTDVAPDAAKAETKTQADSKAAAEAREAGTKTGDGEGAKPDSSDAAPHAKASEPRSG